MSKLLSNPLRKGIEDEKKEIQSFIDANATPSQKRLIGCSKLAENLFSVGSSLVMVMVMVVGAMILSEFGKPPLIVCVPGVVGLMFILTAAFLDNRIDRCRKIFEQKFVELRSKNQNKQGEEK